MVDVRFTKISRCIFSILLCSLGSSGLDGAQSSPAWSSGRQF